LDDGGAGTAILALDKDETHLQLFGPLGAGNGSVSVGSFSVDKDGSNLSLKDSEGFNTSIGSQALVTPTTGEKGQTSAASIHLFGPKGKTLWSAP
jgi:hypothetical protein